MVSEKSAATDLEVSKLQREAENVETVESHEQKLNEGDLESAISEIMEGHGRVTNVEFVWTPFVNSKEQCRRETKVPARTSVKCVNFFNQAGQNNSEGKTCRTSLWKICALLLGFAKASRDRMGKGWLSRRRVLPFALLKYWDHGHSSRRIRKLLASASYGYIRLTDSPLLRGPWRAPGLGGRLLGSLQGRDQSASPVWAAENGEQKETILFWSGVTHKELYCLHLAEKGYKIAQ